MTTMFASDHLEQVLVPVDRIYVNKWGHNKPMKLFNGGFLIASLGYGITTM